MGAIEPIHILIVLIVILVLFGAKRLPELGRNLGAGIREFKKGTQELQHTLEEGTQPQALTSRQTSGPAPQARAASTSDAPADRSDS
jgi:sec-independent protein translocase protein TatA